jgi:hypothetical protein
MEELIINYVDAAAVIGLDGGVWFQTGGITLSSSAIDKITHAFDG